MHEYLSYKTKKDQIGWIERAGGLGNDFSFSPHKKCTEKKIALEYSWRTEIFEKFLLLHNISMHEYLSFKKKEPNRLDRTDRRTRTNFHPFF